MNMIEELKGWVPISAPMIDPRWKESSAIVLARDLFIEMGKKDADLARLSEENNRLTALVEEKEKALADDVDLLAELQVSESRLRVLLAEAREKNTRLQREASTRLAKRGLLVKTSKYIIPTTKFKFGDKLSIKLIGDKCRHCGETKYMEPFGVYNVTIINVYIMTNVNKNTYQVYYDISGKKRLDGENFEWKNIHQRTLTSLIA